MCCVLVPGQPEGSRGAAHPAVCSLHAGRGRWEKGDSPGSPRPSLRSSLHEGEERHFCPVRSVSLEETADGDRHLLPPAASLLRLPRPVRPPSDPFCAFSSRLSIFRVFARVQNRTLYVTKSLTNARGNSITSELWRDMFLLVFFRIQLARGQWGPIKTLCSCGNTVRKGLVLGPGALKKLLETRSFRNSLPRKAWSTQPLLREEP